MKPPPMSQDGMRHSRDPVGGGEVSDPPEQVSHGNVLADGHKQLIERSAFFFLATTDADGWPECAYHGGLPGFVRIVDGKNLAFPYYDGEVMFRSLDNIRVNSKVGLLFIDLEQPRRLRMIGTASIHEDDRLLKAFDGAQLIVRVQIARVFPSSSRHIHRWWLVGGE